MLHNLQCLQLQMETNRKYQVESTAYIFCFPQTAESAPIMYYSTILPVPHSDSWSHMQSVHTVLWLTLVQIQVSHLNKWTPTTWWYILQTKSLSLYILLSTWKQATRKVTSNIEIHRDNYFTVSHSFSIISWDEKDNMQLIRIQLYELPLKCCAVKLALWNWHHANHPVSKWNTPQSPGQLANHTLQYKLLWAMHNVKLPLIGCLNCTCIRS